MNGAYLDGETVARKRGWGAAGKTPFTVAAQVSDDRSPERLRLGRVRGFLSKDHGWARWPLRLGRFVCFDGLSYLLGVRQAALESELQVTGGGQRQLGDARVDLD